MASASSPTASTRSPACASAKARWPTATSPSTGGSPRRTSLIEEDRDEFLELRAEGAFSPADLAAAARAERVIARAAGRLLPELAAIERRLGIV